MNSKERRTARYERRQQERRKKKEAFDREIGGYDRVFTYEHLYRSYR